MSKRTTNNPAGRPPKPPEERMSETIRVRMTDDDRQLIERVASGQLSEWARKTLVRAAKRQDER